MFFNLPLIAIDIGSSSIKLAELTGKSKKKLRTIGVEIVAAANSAEGFIEDITEVEHSLKNLIKKLKLRLKGRRVSLAINGSAIIMKKVKFQKPEDPMDLENTIFYEAEQHFQHNIQDLYFDYYQYSVTGESPEVPVLLVGAKKDVVDQHISLVKSLGMHIGSIECGILSLTNMIEYTYGKIPGLVVILSIGFHSTQVIFMGNGIYLYHRDVPIGGMSYTKNIASRLSVSLDVAEQLKISLSLGDGARREDLKSSIQEMNEQLISEIQMTIDYFFQSDDLAEGFTHPENIFICGGGSAISGLEQLLSSSFKIPIVCINPFQNIEIPRNFPIDQLLEQSFFYGTAIGLSLRSFQDTKVS